jgi:hypothetical protein
LARFEVLGLDRDRDLIRSVARRLAEQDPAAAQIRTALGRAVSAERQRKGGIAAALRRSPLVGADLNLRRPDVEGREIDL